MIREALLRLDGDLYGTYKSLNEMSYDERNRLIEEHILYNDADDKLLDILKLNNFGKISKYFH